MKNDYQAVLQMVRSGESADEIDRVLCNDNTALTGKQIVALRVELIQRDLTAEQIGEFLDEATAASDAAGVVLCKAALEGDASARTAVALMVADAQAQADKDFPVTRTESRDAERIFQDTCRECGTSPVEEEAAILSAVLGDPALNLPSYVANEVERGSAAYWDWLTDQLLQSQADHVREINAGHETTADLVDDAIDRLAVDGGWDDR